jgi:hypothetical protein
LSFRFPTPIIQLNRNSRIAVRLIKKEDRPWIFRKSSEILSAS